MITFCNENDRDSRQQGRDGLNHLFGEIKERIDELRKRLNERCEEEPEQPVQEEGKQSCYRRDDTASTMTALIIPAMMSMRSIFHWLPSGWRSGTPRWIQLTKGQLPSPTSARQHISQRSFIINTFPVKALSQVKFNGAPGK